MTCKPSKVWILKRVSDGLYVAMDKHGNLPKRRTYTRDLDDAFRFRTWGQADAASWPGDVVREGPR